MQRLVHPAKDEPNDQAINTSQHKVQTFLPDEILLKIIQASVDPYDIELDPSEYYDFRNHVQYVSTISPPILTNLKLVNKMFEAEAIRAIKSKFTGHLSLQMVVGNWRTTRIRQHIDTWILPQVVEISFPYRALQRLHGKAKKAFFSPISTPKLQKFNLISVSGEELSYNINNYTSREARENEGNFVDHTYARGMLNSACTNLPPRSDEIDVVLDIVRNPNDKGERQRYKFATTLKQGASSPVRLLVREILIPIPQTNEIQVGSNSGMYPGSAEKRKRSEAETSSAEIMPNRKKSRFAILRTL